MGTEIFPHNFSLKFNDYKKFSDFIGSKHTTPQEFVNPFEFFRIDSLGFKQNEMEDYANSFFKGRRIRLPMFNNRYNDFCRDNYFEQYTGKDEVNNISLWGLSCLKTLTFNCDPRLGKELEIFQSGNPRNGRLDLAITANNEVLVLESKTSLISLLNEGRYKKQISSYYDECLNVITYYNNTYKKENRLSIYLLIGGDEDYLYPPNHPDCILGQVGNNSKFFYDSIISHNIKFISANSLWALATNAQVNSQYISWYDIFPKYFKDEDHIGFLSGGRVILDGDQPVVIPLDLNV